MRTQEQNPAYAKFRHLLPANGRYPARWVDIFSNTDASCRYEDVEVVFVPRGVDGVVLDRDFWDEFSAYNRRWLGDLGNSVAGWMEPGGLNPEKVFGGMVFYGFSSRAVLDEVIAEFAWIEECEWARQMGRGEFPELLRDVSRNRELAEAALQAEAQHLWARDMLTVMRSESAF